jgi:hypothetical protein
VDGDGWTEAEGDCADEDAAIRPDADEVCDGVDNNCDGRIDDVDGDYDGYLQCDDCDDADDEINPGQQEACGDEVDNDCDGEIDERPICAIYGTPFEIGIDSVQTTFNCDLNPIDTGGGSERCDMVIEWGAYSEERGWGDRCSTPEFVDDNAPVVNQACTLTFAPDDGLAIIVEDRDTFGSEELMNQVFYGGNLRDIVELPPNQLSSLQGNGITVRVWARPL